MFLIKLYLRTSSHLSVANHLSHKQKPMLAIQSTIPIGASAKTLLVPHHIKTVFNDESIARFRACQSTFSIWSTPTYEFNALNGVEYPYYTSDVSKDLL